MMLKLLLIVNVFYLCKSMPIRITEHPQSQIAVPGSLVKLQCEYTTDNLYSSVTVHWLFGHQSNNNNNNLTPIASTSSMRVSHTALTITSFDANTHAGLYKCLVNSSGLAVLSRAANVSAAVLEPFAGHAAERTVSISEGNVAIIACPLPYSNPSALPLFYLNDEPVPLGHDTRYKVFASGNLQIVNVRQSDSGVYKCSARNTLTNQVVDWAARTTLQVEAPAGTRLPRIVYVAGDASRVAVGANLTLECVADGAPVPLVSWEKFGGVLPARRSRQIFGNLVIVDVQPEDKGTYVCRAENGPGQATFKTAMLDVHQPPRLLKNEQFVYTAGESEQVRITCPILSDPRTTLYQWFHNGLLLAPLASAHKTGLEKNRSVLTVRAATAGVYQCLAASEFGTAQADLLLNAAGPGVNKQRAQIILGPQNTSIYEGQSVVLLCVTSGGGVQINWLQNDLIIEPTLMRRFEINQQLGNLRIVSVQRSDAGLYKCIASNELGMSSAEAYVTVKSIEDERKRDNQIGAVVSNTRPIVQQIGADKILLKWRLADDHGNQVAYFKVEYKDQMHSWLTIDEQIEARKRQYILTDLALDQVYKFRLSVFYLNGQLGHSHPSAKFRLDKSWQSHSQAQSVSTSPAAFKLSQMGVQIAQIWAISSSSLGLKWKVLSNNVSVANTKIDGFYIYYRRLEPAAHGQEHAVPLYNYTRIQVPVVHAATIDSYLIANLQPSSHYQIKMTCYNLKGDLCSFSNAIYGLTLAPTTTSTQALNHNHNNNNNNNNNSQMHRQVKSTHSEILFMILGAVLAVLSLLLVAFVIMCVLKNKERSKMLGQSLKLASSSCPTLIYEDSLRQNNRVNMYIGGGGANDSNSTNSQSMSTTTSSMTTPAASDHLILLNGQTVSANSFANLPVPPPPPPAQPSATINRINLNMNPLNENFYHTLTQLKDNGDHHADYNNPTINMRNLIFKQQQQQRQQQLLMNTLKNFNMHYCDSKTKSPSCVKRTASKKSKKAKSESKESGIGQQQQQLQQQANYYLLPNCLPAQPMLYNDMDLISAAFFNQNLANGNLVFNHQPKQMCSFEQVASPVNANLMDLFDKANEQIASDLSAAANTEQIYEQTEPKSDESEPMLNAHYATTEINSLDEQNKALCDHVQ